MEEWTQNALRDIEEQSKCSEDLNESDIEIDGLDSLSEALQSIPIDSLLTVIPAMFDPSIGRIVIDKNNAADTPENAADNPKNAAEIASLLAERLLKASIKRPSPHYGSIDQEALILQRYATRLEQLLQRHAAILNK